MITVDEMKELVLYKKPFFIPYNKEDKKKGSAILLLTPNYESSKNLMNIPYMINRNLYTSYYMERNVAYYINSESVEFSACDRYIHGICESPDKSILDDNFKKKSYDKKRFKFVDISKSIVDKYLMEDEYCKTRLDDIHETRVGEIIIDTKTDKLVGYVLIYKSIHKGFITPLFVNEEYRGYGFGTILLDHAINKYGARKVFVYKDNEVAINLYANNGFKIIEYDDVPKTLHFMLLESSNDISVENIKRYYFEDITGFYLNKEHDMSGKCMDEDLTCKTIDSCIKSEQLPSGKYYVYSLDNKNILHKVGYVNVISQYIDKQYTHPQYVNFSYSWIDHVTELDHIPWGIEELQEFANIHHSKMKAISAKIVTQYGKELDKLEKAKDALDNIAEHYSKIESESDREDVKYNIRKFYSRYMTGTDIRYLSYSEFNAIFGDDLKEAINALDKEITSRIKYFESLKDMNHTSKPASQLSRMAVLKFNLIKRCTIIQNEDRERQLSEVINDLSIAVSHYEENKSKFQTASNVEKMKILSLQISQDIANIGSKMVGIGILSLSDLKSMFNVALDVASDNTDSDLIGKLDYMNDSLTYRKYSIKAYDREIETLLRTIDQLNAEKDVLSSNSNGGYRKLIETELL